MTWEFNDRGSKEGHAGAGSRTEIDQQSLLSFPDLDNKGFLFIKDQYFGSNQHILMTLWSLRMQRFEAYSAANSQMANFHSFSHDQVLPHGAQSIVQSVQLLRSFMAICEIFIWQGSLAMLSANLSASR